MSRSKWKGFYVFLKTLELSNRKIWHRSSTICNSFVGKLIKVYNGKDFKIMNVTRNELGFKFGEFALTRKTFEKKKKKKPVKKK
jgi:ribosomal protein S19